MIRNWSNLNRRGFRIAEDLLIARAQRIKRRGLEGQVPEVFGISNRNVHLPTTCCAPKVVSKFIT